MKDLRYSSGAPWEQKAAYSRVVRRGPMIELTGTVAYKENKAQCPGDAYGQALCIFSIFQDYLDKVGATIADVTRTRMYTTDMKYAEEIMRAHGEFFRDVRPTTSLIGVKALITPEYLVEIEATAYLVTGTEQVM